MEQTLTEQSAEPFGSIRGRAAQPVTSFDGTQLYVEEAGSGPTVVFAHGMCLNLTSWHHQIRELPTEYRLVLYDQRGHGLSGRPVHEDWSIEAFARDLEAVIAATKGSDPVFVVGHSLGGMALLQYCEMFPEQLGTRVAGIVLTDTTASDVIGGMLPSAARSARPALRLLEEAAVRAAASNPERFDRVRKARADLVSLMVRLMGFGPKAPREQVTFVEQMLSSTPAEVLVWVIQTLRAMDISTALEAVEVPALVVVGSRDRLTPMVAAQRIAAGIAHAELAVIRGGGHMPMLEKPKPFNAVLRAFLAYPGAALNGRRIAPGLLIAETP